MQRRDATSAMPDNGYIILADEMQGQEEPESRQEREVAHSAPNQHAGQRSSQRILLVEDDQTLAALEAGILTAHGFIVVTVHSGELAIIALRQSIPDLVVLDLELTGDIDGWDVLQALRITTTTIPVLLTTSSAAAVRTYIHTHGESKLTLDHLPKPYPMQTFLKRIKRMLMIAPQ